MVKRHSCMLTYLLYIVIYFAYFILIGKLLSSLHLGLKSDDLLAISLFISAVLAVLTAVIAMNWKKIWEYVSSKLRSL